MEEDMFERLRAVVRQTRATWQEYPEDHEKKDRAYQRSQEALQTLDDVVQWLCHVVCPAASGLGKKTCMAASPPMLFIEEAARKINFSAQPCFFEICNAGELCFLHRQEEDREHGIAIAWKRSMVWIIVVIWNRI